MKYIIEIEDTPISVKESHTGEAYDVYKAKGFRSLVFDLNGLKKLERYEQQSAYQKGYEAGLADGLKQAEKDDEIRVGDEVVAIRTDEIGTAVVTKVNIKNARYIYASGAAGYAELSELKKTGRHFPEVEKLLEAMRK